MSSTLETIAIRTLRLSRNCTQYNHCYINREIYRARERERLEKMALLTDLINLNLSDSTKKVIAEYIW